MITRECDQCGTTYEAERSTSRFCSGGCRVKANRASKAPGPGMVVRLPTRRAAKSGTTRVRVGGPLSVEKRTLEELGAAADTAMGQACLLIARRLDAGVDASGAAVSSLVGRLEKLMESIAAATVVEQVEADDSNPITFLQQRAAERAGRAG